MKKDLKFHLIYFMGYMGDSKAFNYPVYNIFCYIIIQSLFCGFRFEFYFYMLKKYLYLFFFCNIFSALYRFCKVEYLFMKIHSNRRKIL